MVGTSQVVVCRGFRETDAFTRSKADLQALYNLSDEEIEDRLAAVQWGLVRGGDPALVQRIPTRHNLWVAVTPRGVPPLRVYFRPTAVPDECDLLWIEEKL
jgi:hypothetical protein